MKKIILSLIVIMAMGFTAKSQIYNTVGLRASVSNYGVGPELSYQHGLGDVTRVEVGLGLGLDNNFDRFGVTGAFHYVGEIQSGFSWYAGPAVQGWLYSFNKGFNNKNKFVNNGGAVGGAVGAHFGAEYDFDKDLGLPFTASIDSRPMFNFVEYYSGFEFAIGVSIRYVF
ncbi:MAG: hypothetical protein JKX68_04775 [Flavobacteriales bacterium]|nr:hypothetical protein [Flavobacteriales bacterium]